jgi:protein-disulfide isomerase
MGAQQGDTPTQSRVALSIVVHSWAIPIVGVLMLAIGLLGGYFGRPFLLPHSPASVASVSSGAVSPSDTSTSPENQPNKPDELMAFVVRQTRHFKGDLNAPVTIIEFSDFQ